MTIAVQYYSIALGELILGSYKGKLCLCDWENRKTRAAVDRRIQKGLGADYVLEETPVIHKAERQIAEYLAGKRKTFEVPLLPVGSPFQKKVWNALQKIPYGKTVSYGQIAKRIGKPEAIRAVAAVVGANALSLFIPCHRVIGSDGQLTGYAGGIRTKERLLVLEGV